MSLARDILRGSGFYHTQLKYGGSTSEALSSMALGTSEPVQAPGLRALPCVNYLDFRDPAIIPVVLEEPLPNDRKRVAAYAENRHLGIALVAAPVSLPSSTALS